jgi:hypothetical protein
MRQSESPSAKTPTAPRAAVSPVRGIDPLAVGVDGGSHAAQILWRDRAHEREETRAQRTLQGLDVRERLPLLDEQPDRRGERKSPGISDCTKHALASGT